VVSLLSILLFVVRVKSEVRWKMRREAKRGVCDPQTAPSLNSRGLKILGALESLAYCKLLSASTLLKIMKSVECGVYICFVSAGDREVGVEVLVSASMASAKICRWTRVGLATIASTDF
jgi:hypothetical protein